MKFIVKPWCVLANRISQFDATALEGLKVMRTQTALKVTATIISDCSQQLLNGLDSEGPVRRHPRAMQSSLTHDR